MAILLTVLKIAAIALLFIVLVLLLLLLLLLFAPFRYKLKGSFKDNTPDGIATVKWLLGVLGVRAAYHKGDALQVHVTVLGFKVYSILKDKKKDETGEDDDEPDFADFDEDIEEMSLSEMASAGSGKIYCAEEETSASDPVIADSGSDIQTDIKPSEEIKPVNREPLSTTAASQREKAAEQPDQKAEKKAEPQRPKKSLKEKIADFKESIKQKIREKCDSICSAIQEKFDKLPETFNSVKDTVVHKMEQLDALIALYKDEEYAKAKAMVFRYLMKILKEIAPRKGKLKATYGSGDPYSTGMAMQAASILYVFAAKHLDITPDFENSIIDVEANIGGRIRLILFAVAGLRIFFSKKLRKFYKKARLILELDKED